MLYKQTKKWKPTAIHVIAWFQMSHFKKELHVKIIKLLLFRLLQPVSGVWFSLWGLRAKVMEVTLLYWKGLRIGLKERHNKWCPASPFLHSFFLSTWILLIHHPYSHCDIYLVLCLTITLQKEWFKHMIRPNPTSHGYILRNVFFPCRETFPSIFAYSHFMNPLTCTDSISNI